MRKLLLAALPLVIVLGACGGDDDDAASSEPGVVVVEDNVFEPKAAEVSVGDTVTWRFEGQSAHNVVFDDDEASDLMKDGEYERTFEEAGDFDYVCTVHSGMAGSVKVSDGAAP